MSQPTTPQLPARKKRCNSAKKRMIAEALDNQLLEFARTGTPFTISNVRDALLAQPELADNGKKQLRYHVRDRINRLEKMGLATRVDVHGRNRPIYQLFLDEANETNDASNEHEDSLDDAPAPEVTSPTPSQSANRTDDVYTFLERDRHQLNTQMQAAISEAEYYQRVLSHYPHETARITPLLEEAIQRSGTLKGQWDANLMLRRELAGKENCA